MGWIFSHLDRSELIDTLIQPFKTDLGETKVVKHALRGNVLWTVTEDRPKSPDLFPKRTINCILLERNGDKWGCKPMCESMHPYQYSCPLSFLRLAPERSREWRDGVRAYHARRRTPVARSDDQND